MARVVRKYQLDNGDIASIRLDSAIAALGGAQPAGETTSPLFVQAGGSSRRRTGIRARNVVYTTNVGTAEAPSFKRIRIVFFTQSGFSGAPATVSYKTLTWNRTSSKGEDY